MARSDLPSDEESPTTEGAPTAAAFADTILERMAQQDAIQKATNQQLAAIAAILAPLAGNSADPATKVRKQLFDTYRTPCVETTANTNAVQAQTPGGIDLVTVQELAELKQSFLDMKDMMLEGPTSAPLIECLLAETLNASFSRGITDGEAQVEEEQPRNRRRVQVILARPSSSSDEEEEKKVCDSHAHSSKRPSENSRPQGSYDLRSKLRRKSQTIDCVHNSKDDLRSVIEESRAKRVEDSSIRPYLKPRVVDLHDKLNSKSEDLRIKLNRPKRSDLRRKLKETKVKTGEKHEPIAEYLSSDLRVQLQSKRVERAPFLNMIMGGSPPCGDSGEAQVEEEQPRNRRRVQVILARPSFSTDEEEEKKFCDSHAHSSKRPSENSRPEGSYDLRSKLRRKSQTIDCVHNSKDDLRSVIEESRAKRVEDSRSSSIDPNVPTYDES
ncbi:hypothetical protein F2Q69_00059737 [Brassica cretica]|uniref:Uncharacterized protein n=1 Tax=Brassica cretica TaxID=69181 RepID=A0A8S9RMI9_BRACR|nr:hypothetical protein F2Q69_00059737 [Brassica cretica]